METAIKIFSNPQFGEVRTVGTAESPLFCLADICKTLGLTTTKVKQRLNDDVLTTHPILDNLNREQQASFINEDGLYDVILDSRKPIAKQFRKWVTSEVLPAIRKHGGYLTQEKIQEAILNPDTLIQLATTLKEQQQARRLAEGKAIFYEEIAKEQAPKVLFANAVETSKQSCLIGELAKVLKQNGVAIGQNRLFEWLRRKGYLCSKGEMYNTPTQRAMEMKLFEVKKTTINKPDGSVLVSSTVKVTGKGQIYFTNKFLATNN